MNIVFMSMDTLPSTLWARDLYDQINAPRMAFQTQLGPVWNAAEQTAGRSLSSMKKSITALHWTMSASVRQSLNFGRDWS